MIDNNHHSINSDSIRNHSSTSSRKIHNCTTPKCDIGSEDSIDSPEIEIAYHERPADIWNDQNPFCKTLLNKIPGMVFRCLNDDEWTMFFVSDGVQDLTGYTPSELVGNRNVAYKDLVLEEYREEVSRTIETALTSRSNYEAEYQIRTADGAIKWVWERGSGVSDQTGKTLYLEGYIEDITCRKQNEQALRENEQRLRLALEATSDGLWDLNIDSGYHYWSPRSYTMLGYAPNEFSMNFLKWKSMIAPEDREDAIGQFFEQIEKNSPSFDITYRMITKDGGYKWILGRGKPVEWDTRGKPTRFVGTHIDITQQKQAEAEITHTNQLLRAVLDTIPVRIFWKDNKLNYLGCNQPFAEDAGYYSPKDLIGKSDYDMGWHPQADLYRADDLRVIENESSKLNYEEEQTSPDGTQKWLRTNKVPLKDMNGDVIGVLGTYEDITDRKREKDELIKLSRAVSQSPSIVVITNRKGDIEYVNPKFEETTGYTLDEVRGQNPRVLKSGNLSDEVYKNLWATIKSGKEWRGEFLNKRKDGSEYWEYAVISPIHDASGATTHYLATKEDITDRKSLQEQLIQAQKMESVGRLAGGVAHDYNNMLCVISGYATMTLSKLKQDDPLRRYVEEISNAARRSSNITRQLLTFARKQVINPKRVDINYTISDLFKMIRRVISEDIVIDWVPGKDVWRILADPAQVDQILLNLVVNARDAIKDGGAIKIETSNVTLDEAYCAVHSDSLPGQYVMLTVSDDGCGMDKATLDCLFEPFFTTKKVGEGTGLGLCTVYGIVKQHKGFIHVYSEPGLGSTFKVYLPRLKEEGQDDEIEIGYQEAQRGNETILIVEDDKSILELVTTILEDLGYAILAANSPCEAIRLAQKHVGSIDLLVTDMVMPVMNGRELSEKLETIQPNLKKVFMSGYSSDMMARHGVLGKEMNFIQKPFTMEQFADTIRKALDKCASAPL